MTPTARPLRALTMCVAAAALLVGATTPASAAGSTGTEGEQHGRGCVRAVGPGDTTVPVRYDGQTYPVLVHVPRGVARGKRLPLVLNLHGSQSNGPNQMNVSGLRATADANGFLVAAPSAAIVLPAPVDPPDPNGSFAWNVPGVPTTAGQFPPAGARDDVRFLERVIDTVDATLCGDRTRTYATGYSGGGRMVSALACRLSGTIAAIAPVSGLRAGRPDPDDPTVPEVEDCQPSRPVPVVTFHGQVDPVNPYAGSPDLRWGYAVPVAVQTWARLDRCRTGPEAATVSEHVTRLSYARCAGRAKVQLYRVSDGGHTWPGSTFPSPPALGKVTQEIDASAILWSFFKQYRR